MKSKTICLDGPAGDISREILAELATELFRGKTDFRSAICRFEGDSCFLQLDFAARTGVSNG